MIKGFNPQPYDGMSSLPSYVANVRTYVLEAEVPGGYRITLARLTVGDSMSAGNPLTHVLFESYDDHGRRCKTARSRTGGYEREVSAVRNAMNEVGIEFFPSVSGTCEETLMALGEWLNAQNTELSGLSVCVTGVSQSCH